MSHELVMALLWMLWVSVLCVVYEATNDLRAVKKLTLAVWAGR